jgi:electron transfer flavoprotein beta subunit
MSASIVEVDLDGRTHHRGAPRRRRRAAAADHVPCLITMLEGTNEMRFATMDDMLRAARYPVRKWNKDAAGIEDVTKIGLKGSPTMVSKVFGPTPRSQKAEMQVRGDHQPNDVCLNLLQKIFTTHPTLERETSKGLRRDLTRGNLP